MSTLIQLQRILDVYDWYCPEYNEHDVLIEWYITLTREHKDLYSRYKENAYEHTRKTV